MDIFSMKGKDVIFTGGAGNLGMPLVKILLEDGDVLFDDNYFDLNADEKTVKILRGKGKVFSVRSVYDIR